MKRTHELLVQLCRAGGLPPEATKDISIEETGPVLRTPFRVAETGAAAIAASAMAAAWLWYLRRGERQQVNVDAVAATAAMQSYKFMAIGGKPPGAVMDVLTDSYRLQDGRYIYLHCNFPNLAYRNCAVLQADPTPASIAAHVASWRGPDLEQALFEGGGCGAFVRSPEEWYALPQGQAARVAPILEIERIGDSPVEALPHGARPLSGIRVLDLTRVLAGPTCAKNLAEHGAEVLRISRPGLADSGVLDFDTGVGKRSAYVDLRESEGLSRMRALLRDADIFSQAYRPGALASRGFAPEQAATLRPGIIYVSLNAWGFEGPWRERRGYDTVVQCANGLAWSGPQAKPAFTPVAQQDYLAGYLMAYGAMAALARRATVGGSWHVRVSLAACGEWLRAQGMVDAAAIASLPLQVPFEHIAPLLVESGSPAGVITQVGPIARMSATAPRWERPVPAMGADLPQWTERQTRKVTP